MENRIEAKLEFYCNAVVGEGPVWDEMESLLYWVDILTNKLCVYNPLNKSNLSFDVGSHLGTMALCEDGRVILAKQDGFYFFDIKSGQCELIVDPEKYLPNNRFNDGKCSPAGEFWAGTLAYDLKEGAASLYSLGPDRRVKVKIEGVTLSNGLAWNQSADKFYFIDSEAQKIFSYDYDSNGDLTNMSVLREVERTEGIPDGMTIDTEGFLWVALFNGSKVIRLDPQTGKTVFTIDLPVSKVTSCAFGGANLDELYITTANQGLTVEDIEKQPLAGSLFKVKVPFQGLPFFRYKPGRK